MQYNDEPVGSTIASDKHGDACFVCRKINFKEYARKGIYRLLQCEACGVIFVHPQPEINGQIFYDEGYYSGKSAHKINLDNENVLDPKRIEIRLDSCNGVIEQVMRLQPATGKWLDIGCGPGFLLFAAKRLGWEVFGFDVSPFAIQYAKDKFSLHRVQVGKLEEVDFKPAEFDVVSMQHVIEHFFNPLDSMIKIVNWIKPGGIIYIETPDIGSKIARKEGADWEHIKLPEHLFYFSEKTLQYLFRALNCKVLMVRRPVESTGAMKKICGGETKARDFYNRFSGSRLFQIIVGTVRKANEFYRVRMKSESDMIHMIARKK